MFATWTFAERLYAVVLLLALTQGPVYRAWYASGISTASVPNPAMPLVHYATFLGVQIPALMLLSRRLEKRHLSSWGARLLVAFLGWMTLSTLWSVLSRQSAIEVISLTVTALCGLYLVVSFNIAARLQVIFIAMQIGVLASLFAIARDWNLSVAEGGDHWIGIYLNRNSLAPVAAIGVLAGVVLVPKWRSNDPALRSIGRAVIAAFVLLDVFVLWRSESTTSPAALALAALGVAYWQVMRLLATRFNDTNPLVRFAHIVYIAGITVGMWLIFIVQGRLLSLVGETTTFNGRLVHWRFSWNGFLEQPWFGYGWQAAWRDPEFLKGPGWWVLPNIQRIVADTGSVSFVVDPNKSWSHSGYFDILLGGGVIGAAILLALLVVVIMYQRDAIVRRTTTVWNMAIVWFVVAAASQESFIIGNHFLWLLLASVLWAPYSADEQHARAHTG